MSERGGSAEAESHSVPKNTGVDDDGRGTGRTLGKYRIIAELGSGGMATVYLAVVRGPSGFSKLVVVKVLRSHLGQDPETVSMFLDEARLAARLHHPNVVQTNEVGAEAGQHLLVMEYLDGVTLNELLDRARRRGTPLPMGMHLRIIHEALNGLHYAHELADFDGSPLELVHRDISPHNLFVTFDGQAKVLDFGIAKVANSSHDTRTGVIKGKIRYMSPEQIAGDRVDRRADIFSVGAMLWEAATGERLWKGRSDVEIMTRVVNGAIPAPRESDPRANELLDRICRKALAINRDDRYATCLDLQADLEKLLDELGDRSNSRTIGRFLNETFEETRQERKKMIELQLSAGGSGAYPGSLSSPDIPALPGYSSGSHSVDRGRPDTSSGSRERPVEGAVAAEGNGGRGARLAITLGLVALGAVAAIALPRLFAREAAPTAPVATSAPATTSASVATCAVATEPTTVVSAPAAKDVTLAIRTEPATANVFLDGAQLASTPFKRTFPRDGASHVLRAEAAGFVAKTMTVTADADRDVVLALDRIGAAPKYTPPTATTTAPTQPSTATTPTVEAKPTSSATGKKPPKAIDTVNPWD